MELELEFSYIMQSGLCTFFLFVLLDEQLFSIENRK